MARNMKDETSNRKATQKATNSADSDCGCGGKRGESEKKK